MQDTQTGVRPFIRIAWRLFAVALAVTWSWQLHRPALATPAETTVPHDLPRLAPAAEGAIEGSPAVTLGDAAEREPETPSVARTSVGSHSAAKSLDDFAVPRRYARPAPPVADRITLDPSLAETPLLPAIKPSLRSDTQSANKSTASERPGVRESTGNLSRQAVSRSPDIANSWPYPNSLVLLLTPLAADATTLQWSRQLCELLSQLHSTESLGDPRAGAVLEELQQLAREGMVLANRQRNLNQRAATMRAAYGVLRRLAVWLPVHRLAIPSVTQVSLRDHDSSQWSEKLRAVDEQLARLTSPQAWREYLLLDQLAAVASRHWLTDAQERSRLARDFLQRLESADSTPEQVAFFDAPSWQDFAQEMRCWVCEPVDYQVLLDDLERVETETDEHAARDLAGHYQILRWSSDPQIVDLADRINIYYRNANVRIAVSGDLLNRLLPHPEAMNENVNDRLMGGRVLGRSRVTTRLRLVLLPDRERWRMGLEARGDVDSRTETKRGPARFHNAGRSRYLARKLLLIDRLGVHTRDAEATAATAADLTGMETDVDGVPLVNLLVRAIAKQMYERQADDAQFEAEGWLANRAEARLDEEVDLQLGTATNKFRREIWTPLRDLGLRPEAVDMQTTETRLVARYRLAGVDQVAAFTPRPQAPASSLLSIQVHQSVLNNIVTSLDLGGREMGLRDLFLEVANKLQRQDYQVPEDVPDDVTIQLAAEDPVRFECRDNRIHLTLRISKLAAGDGHRWRDFEVTGMYLSDIKGVRIKLERDSYIRLKGNRRRLPLRDQIALRGIFARVLAQHPDVDLLANVLASDSRLHDLRVSQFVVNNGWIGIAVGAGEPVKMRVADEPHAQRSR